MKQQKKHPWRYTLQLISERKGRQVFSFSMPVWVTALLMLLATALTALLVILVMTRTPLKQYLPGYLDMTKRAEVLESAMRVDSLARENDLRSLYLAQLLEVVEGTAEADSLVSLDSATVTLQDTLIAKSQREEAFVRQYEQRERFGIDALDLRVQPQSMTWIVPVKGTIIVPEEDQKEVAASLCTTLRLEREISVLAPLEGTIVNQQYIVGEGWEQTLMASNDYVVILSHLTMVLGETGRQVHAGTALAHAGAQQDPEDRWMSISIWHKGKPIDPATVMTFVQ